MSGWGSISKQEFESLIGKELYGNVGGLLDSFLTFLILTNIRYTLSRYHIDLVVNPEEIDKFNAENRCCILIYSRSKGSNICAVIVTDKKNNIKNFIVNFNCGNDIGEIEPFEGINIQKLETIRANTDRKQWKTNNINEVKGLVSLMYHLVSKL